MKISTGKLVLLFAIVVLPVALGLSLFVNWRNEAIAGEPDIGELLMRTSIALVLFGLAGVVLAIVVLRR